VTLGSNSYNSAGEDDMWVAKFDSSDGAVLWGGIFGGTGDEDINALGADTAGNVMFGGSYEARMDLGDGLLIPAAEDGRDDWFIAKLDSGGNVLYSRSFGVQRSESIQAIAGDSADNWIVAGLCGDGMDLGAGAMPGGYTDICLGKFGP
jgi:hypothetical protein